VSAGEGRVPALLHPVGHTNFATARNRARTRLQAGIFPVKAIFLNLLCLGAEKNLTAEAQRPQRLGVLCVSAVYGVLTDFVDFLIFSI
jgi:hypothetical protein